ncbi:MAG: cytochrome c oxidase subunit II [Actinomycetota bacterium]
MRAPRSRSARPAIVLLIAVLAVLTSACAKDAPQDVFRPAGPAAQKADDLWNIVFPVAVAIFFIVEGLLLFAVIRFRHRPGREAKQFHGNTRLEVLLTAVPALILAGVAVPTVSTIFDLAKEPEGALTVVVVARQFWWEYTYEDMGITTANELHIPTNTPVRIKLEGGITDQVDGGAEVIHSFWVPRLGGTQDIVPGRTNLITLEADNPGTYLGQCKEYCGLGHAYMQLRVIAETPEDFEEWASGLSDEPAESTEAGARLFAEGADNISQPCSTCHSVEATQPQPAAGPNLEGFAGRDTFAAGYLENNDENLSAWLAGPADVKPGAKMPDVGLTQDQIDDLIAYLRTLE